ncbi:hypothetical protein [Clostridium psychrophilum]|uniref:hypothetical protein n=1 Tax=Clostridium psychrophilum TaxID=132926 RepID=UPI001FE5C241|nr:hypothetical protein [Clostridium psychrophilum]
MKKIYYLLIFIPISIVLHYINIGGPSVRFLITALAIVPLAALLGQVTEELSKYTGAKLGGIFKRNIW